MDVTEEIVRCKSHFNQLVYLLDRNEPVGKRINFLLQEIGREINTIGSKSTQTEVIINIVEIKNDLKKFVNKFKIFSVKIVKNLILISAPSGSGKTTLCKALQKSSPKLNWSISYTTKLEKWKKMVLITNSFLS